MRDQARGQPEAQRLRDERLPCDRPEHEPRRDTAPASNDGAAECHGGSAIREAATETAIRAARAPSRLRADAGAPHRPNHEEVRIPGTGGESEPVDEPGYEPGA